MTHEFDSHAFINGERGPVTVCYELDGYKPLGLCVFCSDTDADITCDVLQDEYDRLYEEACQDAIEGMTRAADYVDDSETYYEGEK